MGGCSDDFKIESHKDFLTFLKKNNLPNNDLITFGDKITASNAVKKILDSREALNYEIDGVKQWNPGNIAGYEGETLELTLINNSATIFA